MRHWVESHGHFLTRGEVAAMTGLALDDVAGDRSLVAVPCGGNEEAYPAAQFHGGGLATPGIDVFAAAIGGDADAWDVVAFLTTPLPGLAGQTPFEWLQRGGDLGKVIRLADH